MTGNDAMTRNEAVELGIDPESGAEIIQVTSSATAHDNIYHEVSYFDAGSRWFMFQKPKTNNTFGQGEVWRCDLQDYSCQLVAEDIEVSRGMAVSPDQRYFYCLRRKDKSGHALLRTEIATLEQKTIPLDIDTSQTPVYTGGSAGPDNRTYICGIRLGTRVFGIVKIDLATGAGKLILEQGPDHLNMHPQIEPGKGQDIMVQHNRGAEIDEEGKCIKMIGPEGATLYLIDINGENRRSLPIGKPYTWRCGGHEAWIGSTGSILFSTDPEDADPLKAKAEGIRLGRLRMIRPGDETSRVVFKGDYYHGGANPSKDGRFVVCQTQAPEVYIAVGSIKTGKLRVLHASRSIKLHISHFSMPKPYFSPDCRWVVFNSDRTGRPQIYAAKLPEGILAELEKP